MPHRLGQQCPYPANLPQIWADFANNLLVNRPPVPPIAATPPGGRNQRTIHRWLAHGVPSGGHLPDSALLIRKSPYSGPESPIFCDFGQNVQDIGLSGPEYGDFRINNTESGKCPPEGTP